MQDSKTKTTPKNQASAEAHRKRSEELEQEAADSWERSDTDGFLSQWASRLGSRRELLQADIDEKNGLWEHSALFDLNGNMVPATRHDSKYGGNVWRVFSGEAFTSEIKEWFNPSKARNKKTRLTNNAKKGYYIGSVLAPSHAEMFGSGTGLGSLHTVYAGVERDDRGFSLDNEIVDNGQEVLKENGII